VYVLVGCPSRSSLAETDPNSDLARTIELAPREDDMSNKGIIGRYFEAATQDADAALACFAPGAEFSGPMGALPFPDGVRAYLGGFKASFPDARFEITRMAEEGDDIAVEGFWVGTHTGPMHLPDGNAIPATNKKVRAPFATVCTVKNGKITSHRGYWDMAGFMAQLGLGK
jgi:steroid delta-isomerase-like uncharacterized protein